MVDTALQAVQQTMNPEVEVSMTMNWNPKPHQFKRRRAIPYEMCQICGLLRLRNPLTDWAVRMGCDNDEHPDYRATVRRLTSKEPTQ